MNGVIDYLFIYSLKMLKVTYRFFRSSRMNLNILQNCSYHSHKFAKNLELISNDLLPSFKGFKPLEIVDKNKPLILLYSWLLAKNQHISKYSKFYLDRGIDVLVVRTNPWDLLRPTKGSQVTANNVLEIIHSNINFNPLVVHGFSVGGYYFSESMVQVGNNMSRYGDVLKRFSGLIWDSVVDVPGLPLGVPRAITENKVIQASLERYFRWLLKFNYENATKHYEKASEMFKANLCRAPGLFIFSKSDPVSNMSVNMPVVQAWEEMGIEVFTKCFEKSSHVAHFRLHKSEYEEEVIAFLEKIGILHATRKRALIS
ncbi:Transmembrane protein 53-A [Armadillidium vulgare]|nr:Transmembrane protein 53-A [Armadillidium vulgare]